MSCIGKILIIVVSFVLTVTGCKINFPTGHGWRSGPESAGRNQQTASDHTLDTLRRTGSGASVSSLLCCLSPHLLTVASRRWRRKSRLSTDWFREHAYWKLESDQLHGGGRWSRLDVLCARPSSAAHPQQILLSCRCIHNGTSPSALLSRDNLRWSHKHRSAAFLLQSGDVELLLLWRLKHMS